MVGAGLSALTEKAGEINVQVLADRWLGERLAQMPSPSSIDVDLSPVEEELAAIRKDLGSGHSDLAQRIEQTKVGVAELGKAVLGGDQGFADTLIRRMAEPLGALLPPWEERKGSSGPR